MMGGKGSGRKLGSVLSETVSNPETKTTVETLPPKDPLLEQRQGIERVEQAYKEAREEEKPKRERKRREPKLAEPSPEEIAKQEKVRSGFTFLGEKLLAIICARMPNPLPPTAEESQLFSGALSDVLVKYLPSLGGYDAELTLGLSAVLILAPRLQKEQPKIAVETIGTFGS